MIEDELLYCVPDRILRPTVEGKLAGKFTYYNGKDLYR